MRNKMIRERLKYTHEANLTFDVILDMEMLMKFAPASVATAFASIVLPVPGGPNNKMPLHGCTEGNS